jgi:hypothetical protein
MLAPAYLWPSIVNRPVYLAYSVCLVYLVLAHASR